MYHSIFAVSIFGAALTIVLSSHVIDDAAANFSSTTMNSSHEEFVTTHAMNSSDVELITTDAKIEYDSTIDEITSTVNVILKMIEVERNFSWPQVDLVSGPILKCSNSNSKKAQRFCSSLQRPLYTANRNLIKQLMALNVRLRTDSEKMKVGKKYNILIIFSLLITAFA